MARAIEIPETLITDLKRVMHYCPATGYFTWLINAGWQMPHVFVGKRAGKKVYGTGYWDISWKGHGYKAHRLAWAFMFGPPDPGLVIDHLNGIRDDNRIANLCLVSSGQNSLNQTTKSPRTPSGHTGVYWNRKDQRWYAKIVVGRKQVHLGNYRNMGEAIAARSAGRKLYRPEAYR